MQTPLAYYGGKQRMSKMIIDLIPEHNHYIEPFFGGGAVFFSKRKAKKNTLNDYDNRIHRFWQTVQKPELNDYIEKRAKTFIMNDHEFRKADRIVNKDMLVSDNEFVFYLLVKSVFSFSGVLSCSRALNSAVDFYLKLKSTFSRLKETCIKMQDCQVFNRDALEIVHIFRKKEDAFFYLDPPYPEAKQAYKHKYSMSDFNRLLQALIHIKGKFLLSCYMKRDMFLSKKWHIKYHETCTTMTQVRKNSTKKRTEALIANYDFESLGNSK